MHLTKSSMQAGPKVWHVYCARLKPSCQGAGLKGEQVSAEGSGVSRVMTQTATAQARLSFDISAEQCISSELCDGMQHRSGAAVAALDPLAGEKADALSDTCPRHMGSKLLQPTGCWHKTSCSHHT